MLGKLENGRLVKQQPLIHYFEGNREIFMTNPTSEELKKLGYKEIVNSPLPTPNENEYIYKYYEEETDCIKIKYELRAIEHEEN